MRIVGHRIEPEIAKQASGLLLAQGARANEALHGFPGGDVALMPKGVYHFKKLEDADRHRVECLADAMARLARSRA